MNRVIGELVTWCIGELAPVARSMALLVGAKPVNSLIPEFTDPPIYQFTN